MQKNVLEYLEATAARWPDKPAFSDESSVITFRTLIAHAQSIGTALASRIGVWNRPIAVLSKRNTATVQAFFGVLYSGNYYVPVDSKMPRQRMERLLSTLQPAALLFDDADRDIASGFSALCPQISIAECCETEADAGLLRMQKNKVLDVDPVYVIFTSGSTGVPKGIVISHRSVIDFTDWYTSVMGIDETDVLGNQAPFFFDLSVKDIYTTLKTGAETYILPQKCFSFPKILVQELNAHRVTTISWATSAFHLVANSGILQKDAPKTLRRAILGGEALQAKQLNIWRRALPDVRYVNLYGPTEVTVDCAWYPIERAFADTEVIPIGKACANKEILLLDADGAPVPKGQAGEICVRGSGLAHGYYADPVKTAAAFVQNPLNPNYPDLLYRTGDLAYEGEDGNLRFLSRKDGQIKHSGYRIELGEIEIALNSLAALEAAICLFDAARDKIVCIYQGAATDREIARALRDRLPRYMLPNIYLQIGKMPYTANGKIDRVRLKNEYENTN